MDLTSILLLVITFTPILAYKLFEDAGKNKWYSFIPIFNYWIWIKIVHKSWWWFVLMFIPFLNVFMIFLLFVESAKCYQKYGLGSQALAVLIPIIYLPYLGHSANEAYLDPKKRPQIKKSTTREWTDALIFAVVAATIIRTFMFEAYTIPTSSMEGSLLVGDYLFVSKMAYGPRVPNTPIAFPFVHHTMPLSTFTKSYVEWLKLPYFRFPSFTTVKNNDAVVFNYPSGDTVVLERQSEDYYRIVRENEAILKSRYSQRYKPGLGRELIWKNTHVTDRPVDKRENYIKRCIAIPGDMLEIVDQQVFINGEKAKNPANLQTSYEVKTDRYPVSDRALRNLGVSDQDIAMYKSTNNLHLTNERADELRKMRGVLSVEKNIAAAGVRSRNIFPHDLKFNWNVDNFGPLYIPKAGATIKLNDSTVALYKKAIATYENNDFEITPDGYFINGEKCDEYTFKMDYYWMMGDNRHNSADSRYWGFVPEDHVAGKASLVWLSLDKDKSIFDGKIRWDRIMNIINAD